MLRKNLYELEEGQIGDWAFLDDDKYLAVKWGDDLFGISIVRIEKVGNAMPKACWWWNGNFEKPSLTPSIAALGEDGMVLWHGYLTDGVLMKV